METLARETASAVNENPMNSSDYQGKTAYRGEVATRYEAARTIEPVWQLEQDFVARWATARQPGESVLDVPTGTGRFLEIFRARGLRVKAWDISEDMLAEIRRRWPDAMKHEIDVRAADAERLPLEDSAVDHVLSWRFFHLVPPAVIDGVLREFRRVARVSIVVQVFAVRPVGTRDGLRQKLKARLRPWWRRVRGAKPAAGTEAWAHIASYSHREEDLLAAFDRAGLAVAETCTLEERDGQANRVYFLAGQKAGAVPGARAIGGRESR